MDVWVDDRPVGSAARRARRSRWTRPGIIAVVIAVLGLSAVVMPAAANASHSGPHANHMSQSSAAAPGCHLYGNEEEGYWSACFPTVHMDISWDGELTVPGGEDKGSEIGKLATLFEVFTNTFIVQAEQSSKLHERAQITGTLSDPDCNEDATPSYDGHGNGLLETPALADQLLGWPLDGGGNPTNAHWSPNVKTFNVSYPNCEGGSSTEPYSPGTPTEGSHCESDPDQQSLIELYFGRLSSTGTLAKGKHDTWNFDCTFTNDVWTSTGKATMTENPCPRVLKGSGFTGLRKPTKAALTRLYKALNADGGCYRFVHASTNRTTHAQTMKISVGFRPVGLATFTKSRVLRAYIVPPVEFISKAAGLCGPTSSQPTTFQTRYKKSGEQKPSCHLGD
jgi:hypothetical protein